MPCWIKQYKCNLNNKKNRIFIQLCSTESDPLYDYIWIKKSFINLCQRPQCFCELLQWGSRQRAALYHSQPPVGFCPWLRHTPHSHRVSLSTMDRGPSAGLGAGPSLWARLLHDTQRRIPPGTTTQRLTQIPPTSTPKKNTTHHTWTKLRTFSQLLQRHHYEYE